MSDHFTKCTPTPAAFVDGDDVAGRVGLRDGVELLGGGHRLCPLAVERGLVGGAQRGLGRGAAVVVPVTVRREER